MTATTAERVGVLCEIRELLTKKEIYVRGDRNWVEQLTQHFDSGRDVVYYESELRRMIDRGCIVIGDPEHDEVQFDTRFDRPVKPTEAVRRVSWVQRPARELRN